MDGQGNFQAGENQPAAPSQDCDPPAGPCAPDRKQDDSHFGRLLASLRNAAGLSQMALSLDAGISTRHLCFLELNRSRPSEDMVLKISAALALSPIQQDRLVIAAGFVPRHLGAGAFDPGRRDAGLLGMIAFDAAMRLACTTEIEDATDIAAGFFDQVGIDHFISGRLRRKSDQWEVIRDGRGRPAAGWIRHLEVSGHAERDPLVLETASRHESFYWADVPKDRMSPQARRIFDEAADFRIGNGYILPIQRGDGQVRALSSWGERPECGLPVRLATNLVATAFLGALDHSQSRAEEEGVSAPVKLTALHCQILQEIADGIPLCALRSHRTLREREVRWQVQQAAQIMGTLDPSVAAARAANYGLIGN